MRKLKKDQVLGVIVILISAFFAVNTSNLGATGFEGDPGPKMFPYIGSIIMALSGIFLVIAPQKDKGEVFLTKEQWKYVGILFAVYLLFLALLILVGFVITIPVILFMLTLLFSFVSNKDTPLKLRIIKSLIYAVIVGGALYLLYVVILSAQIPHGILWD